MRKIFNLILLISCLVGGNLQAQQAPQEAPRVLKVASSKAGNYIYLAGEQELVGKDTSLLQNTDHFIIKRMLFVPIADSVQAKAAFKNIKVVGEAKRATSERELRALFKEEDLADIRKFLLKKSNKEVLDFIGSHVKSSDYGLLYLRIETRMMLGQVYLDKEVKEGDVVYYQVLRVDKNRKEQLWGVAMAQSKLGNYALPHLKPQVALVQSTDSSVNISWKLKISNELVAGLPKPKNRATFDPEGNLMNVPFLLTALTGRVVPMQAGTEMPGTRILPVINKALDTLTFNYSANVKKEEQFTAYLMAEDEIYNQGAPSDTAVIFAVDQKSVPLIYGLKTAEIENGIRISWTSPPAKPYITGVEISRYDGQDKLDTLGVVSIADSVYTDYAVKPGQNYRYNVRLLYQNGIGVSQQLPAQATAAVTKFSKPLPPFDLAAKPQGANIELTWKSPNNPGFYGYFVYRGSSPKKMSLIAGPVKVNQYIDTAESLSGRSQYYYVVKSQNLDQDTSVYSNLAMTRPTKKLGINPPRDLLFYYMNGKLSVKWDDVRTQDNFVEGFVLQKKKKGEAEYTTLQLNNSSDAFYVDSLVERGIIYQYRVASLAAKGETSSYSSASEFSLKAEEVETVNLFYVRSITAGIELSLPPMVYSGRKSYTIYRRNVNGGSFEKITAMNADKFVFIDEKTDLGQTYIYAVSVINSDGREGEKGTSLSVKRE